MANAWFRLYSEFADDPKVQMMSEAMQRRLVMLFCLRCKETSLGDGEIAFALRISTEEAADTKKLFVDKGFIDDSWNITNWDDRQFVSDSSAERVKRYRDKRQAAGLNRGSSHLSDPFLYERDCNRCIYCGDTKSLCIDHIYPISKGGDDHYDNLGVSCKGCNSGKAGRDPYEAKLRFINKDAELRFHGYINIRNLPVTVTATAPEQNRTEQIHKKPSREMRESDPRHKSFKEVLKAYFDYHKLKMTWDGAEAKQLSSLLAANPEMTVDQFRTLLHNRTKSRGVNHSKRPSSWIRNATDYGAGPLNEFGQPINAPAPKAVQPLQAPLNALEEIRERNRKAMEEADRAKQAS